MSAAQLPTRRHQRSNSYDRAVTGVQSGSTMQNSATASARTEQNNIYLIKWIDFNHERLPILLQNVNGPCPLLAIVNILLIRKRVMIMNRSYSRGSISDDLDTSPFNCDHDQYRTSHSITCGIPAPDRFYRKGIF